MRPGLRRWDEIEDALLAERVLQGRSEKEIAAELGRSWRAVNVRKAKLGIRHAAPRYMLTDPSGASEEVESLSSASRQHWSAMGEVGEPPAEDIRRSKPCMGLEWALRTGSAWRGWRVRLIEASTKPGRRGNT